MGIFDKIGSAVSGAINDPNFRDNLIMASQSLTLNPNQQLMQMAQSNIKDRKAKSALNQRANATIEMLRSKGVDEAALMSLKNNPEMLMSYAQEYLKKELATPKAPIASIQEYQFAKNQGFKGSFEDWAMKKAQLQGGGKLTEGEGKSTGFFGRMSASNDVINKFEQEGLNLGQTLAGGVPLVGNFMVSENYQQLKNAQDDFLRALLRKESGAVISDEEIATYGPVYFPQAGDGPQVLEQKRQNRERQINSMRLTSGKGASQLEQMQNQGGLNQGITRVEG